MYLKNGTATGSFVDPETRVKIGRGQIVKVDKPSSVMKKWIRSKGLIEVSEAEFMEWSGKKLLTTPEPEVVVSEAPVEETPAESLTDAVVEDQDDSKSKKKLKRS